MKKQANSSQKPEKQTWKISKQLLKTMKRKHEKTSKLLFKKLMNKHDNIWKQANGLK